MPLTRAPLLDAKALPPAEHEAYLDGAAASRASVDVAYRFLRAGRIEAATATLKELLETMEDARK